MRLTWLIKIHNVLAAMEYKFSFISQIIGMFVNDILLLQIWTIFFARFPAVNGWEFQDTVEIVAITCTGFSLVYILTPGVNKLADNIMKGNLDYYLAFPQDVLWHSIVMGIEMSTLGDLFFGIALFLLFVPLTVTSITLFTIATLGSAIILFGTILIYNSLAFYVGRFEEAASQANEAILSSSMYPQTAFHGALKTVLMTIIPAFFINTLPQRLLAHFSWTDLAIFIAVGIVINIAAIQLFNRGLKRYESGNMFQVRI